MTFGPVSQHERRNADLFFADLMGRGARGPSLVRESAERFFEELVGAPEAVDVETEMVSTPPHFYSEGAAEAPPDADKPPTVTQGANADEIIVTRADGTKFHVRRTVRAKIFTRPGRPRIGVCSDDKRVFFRIAWCEGTQGRIDLGANPQGAFAELMKKVFTQISQKVDPEEIKRTLESASVQAFLEVDITKIGEWKITGDVRLDMNRSGIASGSARLSADRGWIKLGVEYKDSGPDNKQVMVTIDIPLEKRKVSGKECPVRELLVWWDVECFREVPMTITLKNPIDWIEKQEKLFLYFEYAKDVLRSDPKIAAGAKPNDEVDAILRSEPKVGTARLNKRSLERLDYLVGQGFWLASVDGYASPEGRRGGPAKTDVGLMRKWEGNDELSRERAKKVRDMIEARYRPSLGMRSSPGQPPLMRFPPDKQMPQAVGKSEQPVLNDRLGKELEKPALERAIINGDASLGVKPFLDDHPEELNRMTEEDQKFVQDKTKSVRDRAERVFENLRRVEINVRHREKLPDPKIVTIDLRQERPCPKDLIEAAQRKWGSQIPFNKPDPPLCNP